MSKRSLRNYSRKIEFFYPSVRLQQTYQKLRNSDQQLCYIHSAQKTENVVVEKKFLYPDSRTTVAKLQRFDSSSAKQTQRKASQNQRSNRKISLSGRKQYNQNSKVCFQKQYYRKGQKSMKNSTEKIRQKFQRAYDFKEENAKKSQPYQVQNLVLKVPYIPTIFEQTVAKQMWHLNQIKIRQRPKSYSESLHITNKNGRFSIKTNQNQNLNDKKYSISFNDQNFENNNAQEKAKKVFCADYSVLRSISSNEEIRKYQNNQPKTFNINQRDFQSFSDSNPNNNSSFKKVVQTSDIKKQIQSSKPMWRRIAVIKSSIAQQRNAQQIASSRPLSQFKVSEAQSSTSQNSMPTNLKTERGNTDQSQIDYHQSSETNSSNNCSIRHQLKTFQKLSPRSVISVHDEDQSLQSSLVIAVGGQSIFGENYSRPSMNQFREAEKPLKTKDKIFTQIFPIRQTQREIASQSLLDLQQ